MFKVGEKVCLNALRWSSDWNGDEVGYPDISVVGLYSDKEGIDYYIDVLKSKVVEVIEGMDD